MYKMVQWTAEHVPYSDDPTILEIGSGNGTLLFTLHEEEHYSPKRLCGIDYSSDAVELAKSIALQRGAQEIIFNTCDFLMQDPPPISQEHQSSRRIDSWDLLLDKGTYDAIALGEKDELGRPPVFQYPSRVGRLLKPGGFFLITCKIGLLRLYCYEVLSSLSLQHVILLRKSSRPISQRKTAVSFISVFNLFSVCKECFPRAHINASSSIKYPTFTFGGQNGAKYSSVAFQKIIQ